LLALQLLFTSHASLVQAFVRHVFVPPLQVSETQVSTVSHVWLPWQMFAIVLHLSCVVHSSVVHTL